MKTETMKTKLSGEISPAQFEEAMRRYYDAGLRGMEINKAIETEVNEILQKYEDELLCAGQVKNAAYQTVLSYCSTNKQHLFGKRRSIGTPWGTAGFRLGTPRLKATRGSNWNTIVTKLKDRLPAYIRTTEEPAKDLLIQHRNREEVAGILSEIGVEIVQDDLFYIEHNHAA